MLRAGCLKYRAEGNLLMIPGGGAVRLGGAVDALPAVNGIPPGEWMCQARDRDQPGSESKQVKHS